ncbi:MAG: hypothetical protein ACKVQS_05820 [Fimbriimonadaceae bacterium]
MSFTGFRAMGNRELLDRILSGSADPRAVLFYGADQAQMDGFAEELAGFWLGVRAESLDRHVDYQKMIHSIKGNVIKKGTVINLKPGEDEDDDDFKGIPVIEFFRTRPLMALSKAIWFSEVNRFTPKAANAFLKCLEELPDHARVVLTTTQFSRVLPTIRSRCLCVACGIDEGFTSSGSEMEAVWGKNVGELARLRELPEIFGALWELLELIPGAPMVAAVMFAERANGLAGDYGKTVGIGVRDAQVILLEMIARWWLVRYPERPMVGTLCSSIAKEIQGYSNGQLGFDVIFGTMLKQIREPMEFSRGR